MVFPSDISNCKSNFTKHFLNTLLAGMTILKWWWPKKWFEAQKQREEPSEKQNGFKTEDVLWNVLAWCDAAGAGLLIACGIACL